MINGGGRMRIGRKDILSGMRVTTLSSTRDRNVKDMVLVAGNPRHGDIDEE